MPHPGADGAIELVRLVRGDRGALDFDTAITFRFDYGQLLPGVQANAVGLSAIAGPDAVRLVSTVPLINKDFATRANFRVLYAAGLDVYDGEPNVNPRVLNAPHTTLLPHIGSATIATRTRMARLACQGVCDVLAGRAPPNVVLPKPQPA